MNFLLYVAIPGFILLWWYGAIKALTQRAPETIGDFVFLFVVFIAMPVGYGYFLWKRKQPNKTRQANLEALVDDLCDFAHSDNYVRIDASLSDNYARIDADLPDRQGRYTELCFRTPRYTAYYSFQQHGYAPISPERMPAVFNALQDRLDGYLTVNATNFSNDPSLRKLDTLSLLLGDEAKAAKLKHQEYMANKSKPQKLKQI